MQNTLDWLERWSWRTWFRCDNIQGQIDELRWASHASLLCFCFRCKNIVLAVKSFFTPHAIIIIIVIIIIIIFICHHATWGQLNEFEAQFNEEMQRQARERDNATASASARRSRSRSREDIVRPTLAPSKGATVKGATVKGATVKGATVKGATMKGSTKGAAKGAVATAEPKASSASGPPT